MEAAKEMATDFRLRKNATTTAQTKNSKHFLKYKTDNHNYHTYLCICKDFKAIFLIKSFGVH